MTNRTRRYKTLEGLRKQLRSGFITAEEMREKRACFKDYSYHNFSISAEAEDEFWQGIAKVVWNRPSSHNVNSLRDLKIGLMSRLMYDGGKYREYSYCAGQDYPGEIRTIQYYARKN